MYTFGPIEAAIGLLSAVITALTDLLTPLAGGAAAALAVICLTALIRLLIAPLSVAQVRAEKTRARLAPRVAELTRKHRGNPERLFAEQRRVYADAGSSPLAGCLPTLAQLPVFVVLYGLFVSATVAGAPNALLAHSLGGVALGTTLGEALAAGAPVLVFLVLMAALTVLAWAMRRWLTLPAMNAAAGPRPPGAAALSYLSFTTVVIAAFVPLAAGLYLAATTAWTVGERLLLRRLVSG